MAKLTVDDPRRAARALAFGARRPVRGGLMVALDVFGIGGGFAIAYWMRYLLDWPPPLERYVTEVATINFVPFSAFFPIITPLVALLIVLFAARGLYHRPRSAGLLDYAAVIVSAVTTGIAIMIVVAFFYRPFYYSRLIFAFAWVTIVLLLCGWRAAMILRRRWNWAHGIGRDRVLVVGGTGLAREVMGGVVAHNHLGYALAGYLDDREQVDDEHNLHFRHIGSIAQLAQVLRRREIETVILALPFWENQRLPELVATCQEAGVEFRFAPDLYELSFDRVDVGDLSGIPLIALRDVRLRGVNLLIKRAIDIALVLLTLPITGPLAGALALAVRLSSPGPVIFAQQRVGKGGKHFTAYKFRTMVADAEARKAELQALNEKDGPIFKIRDDPRRTDVGRALRRTSLDELPQLINIFNGDMSLVGPRPATPDEVARYSDWQRRRLEVMPGLTGLWQVQGRSDTSFDEMVRLDIYYAEHWTPQMDLRILLQTIPAVLSGRGAY